MGGATGIRDRALERAFAGYESTGRQEDAARVAVYLAYHASRAMAFAVGAGWAAQANRLLEPFPASPLHAWMGVFEAANDLDEGRLDAGIELADRTMDMARELGNNEALYLAMGFKGMGEVIAGRWKEGLALLDEASAAALSGNLELRAASDVLCITIGACRNLGDLERAGQWAEASERWMRRNGAGGYPGICRIHRAELKMLHGHWSEAEEDAPRHATSFSDSTCSMPSAWRTTRSVKYGSGWATSTEPPRPSTAPTRFGHNGQPGLARLQLARGQVEEAQRSIARPLRRPQRRRSWSPRARSSPAGPGRDRPRGRQPRYRAAGGG